MRTVFCLLAAALLALALGAASGAAGGPEALRAEIESLKPSRHPWREIAWKTCPLEALKEAREKK